MEHYFQKTEKIIRKNNKQEILKNLQRYKRRQYFFRDIKIIISKKCLELCHFFISKTVQNYLQKYEKLSQYLCSCRQSHKSNSELYYY